MYQYPDSPEAVALSLLEMILDREEPGVLSRSPKLRPRCASFWRSLAMPARTKPQS